MNRSDLTRLQIRILLLVREEGGRLPTESVYDLVEEVRPTHDEDGEELEGLDPYETSREELGALEAAGLLADDENTNWAMGATVFTDAGREMAEHLAKRVGDPEGTLRELAEVLWPEGDADHSWSPDTIDEVARVLTDAGFRPAGE